MKLKEMKSEYPVMMIFMYYRDEKKINIFEMQVFCMEANIFTIYENVKTEMGTREH